MRHAFKGFFLLSHHFKQDTQENEEDIRIAGVVPR